MVVQGGFSLQLIDAETQQPLNEYRGPSGSVYYAEAKPGGEYFLRFHVMQDEVKKEVDGKDLGFYTNLTKSQGARDVGLWTYINGIGTNQALKFDAEAVPSTGTAGDKQTTATAGSIDPAAVSDGESNSATGRKSPPLLLMGNVQVKISKGIFTGNQKRIYTSVPALTQEETVVAEVVASISASSSLQEEEEDANTNTHGNNGAATDVVPASTDSKTADPIPILRSREGAAKLQQAFSEECPTYQPGELLETITIHYGSTAALIQAGILVPISGAVPEYVGVPPPATVPVAPHTVPPAVVAAPAPPSLLTTSVANKQEKLLVPNPLLNTSSSTPKRQHCAVSEPEKTQEAKDDEIKEPVAKKPCIQATSKPVVAAVVSTK